MVVFIKQRDIGVQENLDRLLTMCNGEILKKLLKEQ